MQVTLKLLLQDVMPEIVKLENGKKLARCLFTAPAYVDQFGDKKGEDETVEITIFDEKKIEAFIADVEKTTTPKIEVNCFLNSRSYEDKDGKTRYALNLTLNTYKWK
jgi:single-stranded DNA-binding protein